MVAMSAKNDKDAKQERQTHYLASFVALVQFLCSSSLEQSKNAKACGCG